MIRILIFLILPFISVSLSAQVFQDHINGKTLIIDSLNGVTNLGFKVELFKKRTSVTVEILYQDLTTETKEIYDKGGATFSINAANIKEVRVVHKRKFIFKFKNKIDYPKDTIPKRTIKRSNRTRVTSTGGSGTSTEVVAT
ncbi:MAG: hypothetical protein UZ12_BCD005000244 [Bacteroidetes bacterium OLB12]|nr:MAG: hypothetical protein UZ12_BCD005000244 [Bacteroidetes bacterium OLB12]HNR73676.1 hypothetical protein [Cyclobacteriaceae bacterium]HNU42394.1 hypothetical protein [Cyclobacteriaceae bacterium]